ncbi:hypothetical protein HY636_01215 [Candidatus Woesearchaeota archaeon]|nr:hypothetical protein [Candidatus Woesearchaeota archaeon]
MLLAKMNKKIHKNKLIFASRKSQGLPINLVIIAAISLIVLVVLLYIFTGNIGKTSENIGSCRTKGGECANNGEGECKNPKFPIPIFVSNDCQNTNPKNLCCLKAGT